MIVNMNHKVSCYVQEGMVIVDRGESQSVMSRLGRRGDSCKGRESQIVMLRLRKRGDSGHNLQGLVLCPGGR